MEDVEILPNPEFFTYIQKHTVYLNLTIYRSLSHAQKNLWQQTEWLVILLQSQERLWLRFPVQPAWSLFLCTFNGIFSHCMLIYSSFHRAQVHSVPRISSKHRQRNYFTLCTFCVAQPALHLCCITPDQRASLHCPFQSVLICSKFLISSIPGPTFQSSHLSLSFLSHTQPYLSPTPIHPLQGNWHCICFCRQNLC